MNGLVLAGWGACVGIWLGNEVWEGMVRIVCSWLILMLVRDAVKEG